MDSKKNVGGKKQPEREVGRENGRLWHHLHGEWALAGLRHHARRVYAAPHAGPDDAVQVSA